MGAVAPSLYGVGTRGTRSVSTTQQGASARTQPCTEGVHHTSAKKTSIRCDTVSCSLADDDDDSIAVAKNY